MTSAADLEFFDASTPNGEGALTPSGLGVGTSTRTLNTIVGSDAAWTIAGVAGISNGIAIGATFSTVDQNTPTNADATLVHEAAHYAYQLTDDQFGNLVQQTGFDPTKYGFSATTNSSILFNNFIAAKCPGSK